MRLKKREEEKEDPEDSFPTLEAFLSASSIHGLRYLRGAGRGSSGKAFPKTRLVLAQSLVNLVR